MFPCTGSQLVYLDAQGTQGFRAKRATCLDQPLGPRASGALREGGPRGRGT